MCHQIGHWKGQILAPCIAAKWGVVSFPSPLALSETAILSKWGGCAAARCVVAVLGALGIGIPQLHFRYETITFEEEEYEHFWKSNSLEQDNLVIRQRFTNFSFKKITDGLPHS